MATTNITPKLTEKQVCQFCQSSFTPKPCTKGMYCSRKCHNDSIKADKSKQIIIQCGTCGIDVECLRTHPKKHCSHKCAGKANIKNLPHTYFKPTAYTATCETCAAEFITTPSTSRGRFCSSKCFGKWLSKNIVGENHPSKGRKFGRAKHLPPPTTIKCRTCETEFIVKPNHVNRRLCCSRKCLAIYNSESGRYSGENNYNWKGGYAPYYGKSWRPAQKKVHKRDKICRECQKTIEENGKALDVHHLIPFRLFGVKRHLEANALSNLIALCNVCHTIYDSQFRKIEQIYVEIFFYLLANFL